jgi:hypothetical protein
MNPILGMTGGFDSPVISKTPAKILGFACFWGADMTGMTGVSLFPFLHYAPPPLVGPMPFFLPDGNRGFSVIPVID